MLVIKRKILAGPILALLLTSTFVAILNVQRVKAIGPIYIRADGSIDPPTAPIITYDYVTYTLIGNITSSGDGIVVERDNIIIDGAEYMLQEGTWAYYSYYKGIDLSGRTNVTVKNIRITAFYYGVYLSSSTSNIVRENDIAENGWFDHGCGIYLISSSNNTILENVVTQDWVNGTAYGIRLENSPYNTICGNSITNCVCCIALSSSSSNVLANNTMSISILFNNTVYSIWPFHFAVFGLSLAEYVNYVDASNTVGGKPIYYWVNKQGLTVPSDAGCVILVNCTDITVQNLNLTGNFPSICLAYTTDCTITENEVSWADAGILLHSSSNNVISKNKVSSHWGNNWMGGICLISSNNNILFRNDVKQIMNYTILYGNGGISLDSSSHNMICENTIAVYHRGIFLNSSTDNTIYHNNFINSTQHAYTLNSVNVWDDGYPSGGNYWSDYAAADLLSGPYQNETGSDGIGDTPHIIDAKNRDRYPLMNPWTLPPTPDFSITASPTSLIIQQGDLATSTITIASVNGFDQPVQLTVSGASTGVTTTLSPEQVIPPPDGSTTSSLTVSAATTATAGSYTLTVTGTSGTLTHSVDISLEITSMLYIIEQPELLVNESWLYVYRRYNGPVMEEYLWKKVVADIEEWNGQSLYKITDEFLKNGEIVTILTTWRTTQWVDFRSSRKYENKTVEKTFDPGYKNYEFPLYVGKEWRNLVNVSWTTTYKDGKVENGSYLLQDHYIVIGEETVTVKAGEFRTLVIKVDYSSVFKGYVDYIWFSSATKNWVKWESYFNSSLIEAAELQSLEITPPPLDTTPPTTPVVTDDGKYTSSTTWLHATWSSSDPESGIAEYQYAIGTSPGGTDVVEWASAGTATEVTHSGLNLIIGGTYYFSVKAKNGKGLWSEVGTSDGITNTPYTTPAVVEWNRTYGTTNNDWAVSLLQTSDGGFAMAGPWNIVSTGDISSFGIVKTDLNGNAQWTRAFEVGYASIGVGVFDICALFETEGRTFVFSSSINVTGNIDIWLVKVDEDGQPIWNHTYGGTGNEKLMSAIQTDDNGFLLVASNYTTAGLGTWIVKTDAYGNVEWEKTYKDWIGCYCVRTVDGGFALTGGLSSSNDSSVRSILLKMDVGGNILWNQTILHYQTPISIIVIPRPLQVADKGFVLVGTQFENNNPNILLVRTDEDGNIEWNKTYDDNGWEIAFAITEMHDGYAILGVTNSSMAGGLMDVWLVRTDLAGNILWDSTYGGEGMDVGFSIILTEDGGLAFAGGTNSSGAREMDFWLVKLSPEIHDDEPPVIKNVRHEPLYPMENETIYVYADVTDNVAVASVQLNYTLNRGTTWLLQDMTLTNGNTYSTSMGPFNQFKLIGFYIIAYDTSGNKAYGSEIVPPLPEPPKVAPIVVSNDPPNPLPNGNDVSYDVINNGTEIYVNVTELGIYDPGLWYNISYSLDGGITWVNQQMTQVSDYVWKHWVNATTNILFKVVAGDGTVESRVYWIIVGPWKYPIYLYFSNDEKYFPVAGLDFDGDSTVENNWISYETTPDYWKLIFEENDLDNDGTRDLWSYAYMNPKSINDGCLVIEYWIYYSFNEYAVLRPVFRGDHEHDFECVYLWIDVATGAIKKIALSQHNWVNHYTFLSPPKRLNIAVEKGGHGMALLKDENDDGLPEDFDIFPGYDIWQPEGGGTFISGTWNDQSLVASLYPWVIYDPRIPVSKLHLFSDHSILTTGFSLEAISPLLPNIVDETPQYYAWVTDMLGYEYVLKTSYGAPLPLSEDKMLVFQVSAPWYRQEFQDPSKMWNKVPWVTYTAKVTIKTLLPFIKAGIFSYFKIAIGMPWIEKQIANILTGWIAGEIIDTLFDPIRGSVQDSQGKVLGYTDDKMEDEIPGSFVFLTRDMTNNMYDLYLIVTNSTDDYIYEAKGESTETYNMTISSANIEGREINFNVVNIPTKPNSVHRYIVHWDALERKEDGVEVWVDQNGDGNFESKFWSDRELTASEFAEATADAAPPSTVHDYDGVWHTADFTINLNATDDPSGVAETFYRINDGPIQNVSTHGQPRITLESTNNTLEYWSVDNVGNEESHHILTGIKLDKTAPSIGGPSREPAGDVQPYQPVKVSVNVTDATSNVKNVTMYYSLNNGTSWEEPISMNYNVSTSLYEATIPGQEAGTWVKYKIVAYDHVGNNVALGETEPYLVYQVIPEFPLDLILPIFMILFVILTMLAIVFAKKKAAKNKA